MPTAKAAALAAPEVTTGPQPVAPMLINVREAARRLGLGIMHVRKLVRSGELHTVQVHKVWSYVETRELEEFIARRRVNHTAPAETSAADRSVFQNNGILRDAVKPKSAGARAAR